jgi:hypothetical protein
MIQIHHHSHQEKYVDRHNRSTMALLMNKRRVLSTVFSMATVAALSTQCVAPERMLMSDNMKASNLQTPTMFPITVSKKNVLDESSSIISESAGITSADMIHNHLGEHGALCFVVRRPG